MLGVNGKPVRQADDLVRHISELRPGDAATLSIFRDGARRELKARLTEMPPERVAELRR